MVKLQGKIHLQCLRGKNFSQQCWKVKVAQPWPTFSDPMEYSPQNSPGQNTGVGSLSLLQGNLPNPGIEPRSPALQEDSLPAELSDPIKMQEIACVCRGLGWTFLAYSINACLLWFLHLGTLVCTRHLFKVILVFYIGNSVRRKSGDRKAWIVYASSLSLISYTRSFM